MGDFTHLIGGVKSDGSPAPEMTRAHRASGAVPSRAYVTLGGRQYQKDAGSCTEHGYGAAVESWARTAVGADLQVCRLDGYYISRLMEGNGAERIDGGAYPSMVRLGWETRGRVTEARAPYDTKRVTTYVRPVEWEADAQLLKAKWARIPNDIEAMLPYLANGTPIPICHTVVGSMVNLGAGGIEGGGGPSLGKHCRLVVGYDLTRDDLRGSALVMTSWTGWGIPHPAIGEDSRFVGLTDSFSWVPFSVVNDPKWLDDAAVLSVPPVGVEA